MSISFIADRHRLTIALAAILLCCVASRADGDGKITRLGQLDLPGTFLDVWGWVDPATDTEYAIMGGSGGLYIVDVSDPTNPKLTSHIPTDASFDMKTYQNYLYAVDGHFDKTDGVIFDISDPASPAPVDSFPTAHNIFIDETRGLMVLCFVGTRIFDLTADPTKPVLLWDDEKIEGHDATIVGQILYDFHGRLGTFIYDISAPASPVLLGKITDPEIMYHHSGWTSQNGVYLFINDELSLHPQPDFTVWNVRNPRSPRKIEQWADSMATIHNSYRVGNLLHTSYYSAGYRVFDISDPTSITLCDEYDTSHIFGENFRGAFGCYPFSPSGNVFVSDANYGLFIFSFGPRPPAPEQTSLYQNVPNPFNPTTAIEFFLPVDTDVALSIYDVKGRLVRKLMNGRMSAGQKSVEWNAMDESGRLVPSGVYFYRLQTRVRGGDKEDGIPQISGRSTASSA